MSVFGHPVLFGCLEKGKRLRPEDSDAVAHNLKFKSQVIA